MLCHIKSTNAALMFTTNSLHLIVKGTNTRNRWKKKGRKKRVKEQVYEKMVGLSPSFCIWIEEKKE